MKSFTPWAGKRRKKVSRTLKNFWKVSTFAPTAVKEFLLGFLFRLFCPCPFCFLVCWLICLFVRGIIQKGQNGFSVDFGGTLEQWAKKESRIVILVSCWNNLVCLPKKRIPYLRGNTIIHTDTQTSITVNWCLCPLPQTVSNNLKWLLDQWVCDPLQEVATEICSIS